MNLAKITNYVTMRKATQEEIDSFVDYRANHIALVRRIGRVLFGLDLSEHDKEKLRKTIIDTTAQLKVNLTEMEEKKKKVIFSLTKGNIDEETLNQLCEIIDKSRGTKK